METARMYLYIMHTNRLSRSVMAAVVNHSFQIAQSFQNPGWIRLPDASERGRAVTQEYPKAAALVLDSTDKPLGCILSGRHISTLCCVACFTYPDDFFNQIGRLEQYLWCEGRIQVSGGVIDHER